MTTEMTVYDLEILNKVMMRRITKGYTSFELSFLIGRPLDYIRNVESLKSPIYNRTELSVIAAALGDEDHYGYLPSDDDCDDLLQVSMQKTLRDNKFYYTCTTHSGSPEAGIRFMVYEDSRIDEHAKNKAASIRHINLIRDAVLYIKSSGFFATPKMPFDILHKVNSLLSMEVNVSELDKLTQWFSDEGALLQERLNLQGRYCFTEIGLNK